MSLKTARKPGQSKLISGRQDLFLGPVYDGETIRNARDLFGYIDPVFENYSHSVFAEKTAVSVHELIEDGNFSDILWSLNSDASKICFLAEGQVNQFVKKYRRWLREDGQPTFSPIFSSRELRVLSVHVGLYGALGILSFGFLNDTVWTAELRPRIVVPKVK